MCHRVYQHSLYKVNKTLHITETKKQEYAGPILQQAFGIDSSNPFVIQIPEQETFVNISEISEDKGSIYGGYQDETGSGTVTIDINLLSLIGSEQEKAYTGLMIVSNEALETYTYYVATYKYNRQTEHMELLDSARLGQDISIDAYEPSNDLVHIELTKNTNHLNNSQVDIERLSIIACISKAYSIDLLQERLHN